MPYTKESLPDDVKNLPTDVQEIWLTAFDNATEEYKDEGKAFTVAWSAVKKAGYAKTSVIKGEGVLRASESSEDGYKWKVRVIQAGLDNNNVMWSESVLKNSIPFFEGRPVFVLSEAQHSEGHTYGKPPLEIVGWLKSVSYLQDGLYGDFIILRNTLGKELRDTLVSSFGEGKTDLLGLSVDVIGSAKDVGSIREVEDIYSVTVDIVYEPAAGGKFLRLAASKQFKGDKSMNKDDMEVLQKELAEQKKCLDEQLKASKKLVEDGKICQEELQKISCANKVDVMVKASGLPDVICDKIKTMYKDKIVPEDEVKAFILSEKECLDKVTACINSLGHIRVGADDYDNRIKMIDAFFNGEVRSFRSAYVNLTGDEQVTGIKKNFTRLKASMDSTTFGEILGDSITRKMVKEYNSTAYNNDWKKICDIVAVNDFRTNRRVRQGGYSNLPIVNQGAAYTALSSPTDEEATYAVVKRGGTEDVTLEMIKNDDMGVIKRIPIKLATAAHRTLTEFVWDFIEDNGTIYDATALFTVGHGNLGSAALDLSTLNTRRIAMAKQAEKDSSKRLGLQAKYLVVPLELAKTAYDLISAPRNSDFDPTTAEYTRTLQMEMIVVGHWTDANNFYLVASPRDIVGLEIAFLNGKEEPELFIQDQETTGSVFTNDKITFKMRHIYSGAILDYRAFDGSIVA